jgi:hypothetical protein
MEGVKSGLWVLVLTMSCGIWMKGERGRSCWTAKITTGIHNRTPLPCCCKDEKPFLTAEEG